MQNKQLGDYKLPYGIIYHVPILSVSNVNIHHADAGNVMQY